jgi:plasmid stabilization system protein ParE
MRIEWLIPAIRDLQRLRNFILPHNTEAARRAVSLIKTVVTTLEANPHSGKPSEDMTDYRDIVIPFGSAGYVLRYRIQKDVLFIVAIKHCKEAGFPGREWHNGY